MFDESPAATADSAVLSGVLGCSFGLAQDKLTLRRAGGAGPRAGLNSLEAGTEARPTGTNTLRLPDGTPVFAVSPQQFMKHPG